MDTKKFNLDFGTSFSDFKDINPNFAIGKMRIAYAGRNRNKTEISKDVFEEAIPTMFNCPVVARYDREKNMFGGHDIEVVVSDNAIKVVNATTPIGIVPYGAQWCWEEVTENDGQTRQYLCVEVLFWKRQEGYEHLVEIGSADQSMEVDFVDYHKDADGYYVAEKICFSAFCLLEAVEPCFESASVELFSFRGEDEYKRQFALMLDDLRQYTESSKEGDEKMKEFKEDKELEVKDACNPDKKKKKCDDEEELEVKDACNPGKKKKKCDDEEELEVKDACNPGKKKKKCAANEFSCTYVQKREAIQEALPCSVERNEDDEVVKTTDFWLCDFDDDYAFVEKYTWVREDCNSDREYGRMHYAFNDAELTAIIDGEFEKMVVTWVTEDEYATLMQDRENAKKYAEEFAAYKDTHSVENSEVEKLREYKMQKMASERESAVNELFAKFADLAENEEFKQFAASEEIASMELSEIENKCFAIRGKSVEVKFSNNQDTKPIKLPAITGYAHDDEGRLYGGLFEKFGFKNKD